MSAAATAPDRDRWRALAAGAAPALWIGALFALDRLTKNWALAELAPRGSIEILPYLRLTYAENTGVAFGQFQDSNLLFTVVGIVLLAALLYYRRRLARHGRLAALGVVLVLAGALGNLFDRIVYGHVIDFIDLVVWPIFNVADSCICVGVACLAVGVKEP